MSESEIVRIFQNRKMSEFENVDIQNPMNLHIVGIENYSLVGR